MSKKILLLGAITGAAIGASCMLFATPASGKEIRSKYKQNLASMKYSLNKVKSQTTDLKVQAANTAKLSIETVKEFTSELNDSVKEWKTEVAPIIAELHTNIDALQQTIAETKKTKREN